MNVTLTMELPGNDSYNVSTNGFDCDRQPIPYTGWERTLIVVIATFLCLITAIANLICMIAIRIDKKLQKFSNYFVFSLAIADFAVGLISMPVFTLYKVLGYWPLGPRVCDTWLSTDYVLSNASVLHILIISMDRYVSVTRPLAYRANKTKKKAAIMIGSAWGISLLLWPPWIYAWPYIEGTRIVPNNACYIQFIETNHYITFGTAIAAFYIPVAIMSYLNFRIWRETEKHKKTQLNLQEGTPAASKRINSSDEGLELEESRRQRSESSGRPDTKTVKILTAIVGAFVLTWTPYNVLVLVKSISACSFQIPQKLWDFSYYFCYINSTVNPALYGLCNTDFRKTYVRILKCKWHSIRNRGTAIE
ncbi:muscarinic acetylcholine receptor DM1-like [Temnothorax longispinosus]|uniref:muscarinic acetylcholine receptor DM1-like n=1 Tax=Temnothorax longispinosus TaxID=300112 RepID=UPI003A993A44